MMAAPYPQFDRDQLETNLRKVGLIASDEKITLEPYSAAYKRISTSRRHYRLHSGKRTICHLITGPNLAGVHQKTTSFHRACPEIICKPLFFFESQEGTAQFGLEHFEGVSLDTLVQKENCAQITWIEIARKVRAILDRSRRPSGQMELEREISRLINAVKKFPGVTEMDARFLHETAVPILIEGASSAGSLVQWSNGDFCGRNLLVDKQGGVRLIDYEFSSETHLQAGDWLRLKNFSILPAGLNQQTAPELFTTPQPWEEIWFWLQQLSQLGEVAPSDELTSHVNETIAHVFSAIAKASRSKPRQASPSFLVDRLIQRYEETLLAFEDRTRWAKSLDEELQKALGNWRAQTKLADERLEWATRLSCELDKTRKDHEKLSGEFHDRTVWAKSLNIELQNLTAAHQRVQTELGQYKQAYDLLVTVEDPAGQIDSNAPIGEVAVKFAHLRKEVAKHDRHAIDAEGQAVESQLAAQAAAAEIIRLQRDLTDAQVHVDHLLRQIQELALRSNSAIQLSQSAQATIQERDATLGSTFKELASLRNALDQYENNWFVRVSRRLARITAKKTAHS